MNRGLLSSNSNEWCTPPKLFDDLNKTYHFTLDPAATHENAKCKKYFTKKDNGLAQSWKGHTVFCNPPYGREIGKWVKKAYIESLQDNTTVVLLIPARTDTGYWHDYIENKAKVLFIRGRIKFVGESGTAKYNAPFPSAIVIYRKDNAT